MQTLGFMRINVTKSFLPPLEEYNEYLKQIWENNWLTNQGPLLQEFETQTRTFLGVDNFHFVTNGTLALQLALRALDITEGEIITTPFSYVATTSAILWEKCQPLYVDIEPDTFCIDADKIEAAITDKTKAILAVHVFGHPCDTDKIGAVAKKHGLKVIYDAAHAFGVEYKGRSLLDYGDISTCSFHATKPFHTIEGGCVITNDKTTNDKLELINRFGHEGDIHKLLGLNAKASEFQAAMGLCNLGHVDSITEKRKEVVELYNNLLGDSVQLPKVKDSVKSNFAYYPVLFGDEEQLLRADERLQALDIYCRRYFYPSLNTLPYVKDAASCPVSEDIASRILCLPLYPDLDPDVVRVICEVIAS